MFFWIMISSGIVFAVFYLYVLMKEKHEKNSSEDSEGNNESESDSRDLKIRLKGYDRENQIIYNI